MTTSTGIQTATSIVSSARCKLESFHATNASGSAITLNVWDSGTATISGKIEVTRMVLPANSNLEYDMHGRIMAEGIYVVVSAACAYSVEYS
tara:strand:- start:293 stop:568 length:276 start_codon:yes stop_codon:yes gene_type:complete